MCSSVAFLSHPAQRLFSVRAPILLQLAMAEDPIRVAAQLLHPFQSDIRVQMWWQEDRSQGVRVASVAPPSTVKPVASCVSPMRDNHGWVSFSDDDDHYSSRRVPTPWVSSSGTSSAPRTIVPRRTRLFTFQVPFLFPQEAYLRAPFFVFEENYIWSPSLTVPPESSPSGSAFFFQPSTEIKPTWCCLVVFQASYEGNQPENVVLFFRHSTRKKRPFARRNEGGKGKGKERRTKLTCVHPSFFPSPLKRKLQPPTNKQPTTNQLM